MTAAAYTGNAEDFAAVSLKVYIVKCLCAVTLDNGEVLNIKSLFYILWFFSYDIKVYLLTHHSFRKRLLGCILCRHGVYMLALAENCNTVGNFQNLVELVSDYDN